MAKSKIRGGAKEHRKRVEKRNNQLKADERAVNKLRQQIFEEARQRYLDKQSGTTETFKLNLNV
jgi:hypothetical protein